MTLLAEDSVQECGSFAIDLTFECLVCLVQINIEMKLPHLVNRPRCRGLPDPILSNISSAVGASDHNKEKVDRPLSVVRTISRAP